MGEIQTLDEALSYLRLHPSTKGPVILTPDKMRAAVGIIEGQLERLDALREAAICPFDKPDNKLADIEPTTPCPVCGDLGTWDADEAVSRCVSNQPSPAPLSSAGKD
jgi:hypothetical protein